MFAKLDSLNPIAREIIINLICALILAGLAYASRATAKRLAKGGAKIARFYADLYLQKHLAHHAIFGAKDLPESLRLFFLVILTSISWLFLAGIFLVFFYGVKALADRQWLVCLGHWFALNCLIEGYFWAKDSRNDKVAKAILEEKHEEQRKQIQTETKQP